MGQDDPKRYYWASGLRPYFDGFDSIRTWDLTQDLFRTRDLTRVVSYGIKADSRKLGSGHPIGLPEVGTRRLVVLSHNGEMEVRRWGHEASRYYPTMAREAKIFGPCV